MPSRRATPGQSVDSRRAKQTLATLATEPGDTHGTPDAVTTPLVLLWNIRKPNARAHRLPPNVGLRVHPNPQACGNTVQRLVSQLAIPVVSLHVCEGSKPQLGHPAGQDMPARFCR